MPASSRKYGRRRSRIQPLLARCDPRPRVREQLAATCSDLSESSVETMLTRLASAPEPECGEVLVPGLRRVLGGLGTMERSVTLTEWATSPNPALRWAVGRAIERAPRGPGVLTTLGHLAEDQRWEVRQLAARIAAALHTGASDFALEILEALAVDTRTAVASCAADELRALDKNSASAGAGRSRLGTGARLRVIVADSDAAVRSPVVAALEQAGHDVVSCTDSRQLLRRLNEALQSGSPSIDLVISDVCMPGLAGSDILTSLRRQGHRPHVILLAAAGSEELRRYAFELGAVAVLDKPVHVETLVRVVGRSIRL